MPRAGAPQAAPQTTPATARKRGRNLASDKTRRTGEKAAAFLCLLARIGKVAPCARAVGMSARSAYRLRQRARQFAELWDVALVEAARRRALERPRAKAVHPLLAKEAADDCCKGPDDGSI